MTSLSRYSIRYDIYRAITSRAANELSWSLFSVSSTKSLETESVFLCDDWWRLDFGYVIPEALSRYCQYIPERLRGVFTTRRYTNPRLPYLYLTFLINLLFLLLNFFASFLSYNYSTKQFKHTFLDIWLMRTKQRYLHASVIRLS